MKNFSILFLALFLIGVYFLPIKVLAAGDGFSCVCSDGTCAPYATEAEANLKCKNKENGVTCAKWGGDCSNKNVKEVPPDSQGNSDPKAVYVKLDNPLGSVKTPTDIIGQVIKVAMSVMGGVVLLMIVKGATTWITAGGNPENIQSGTKTIIWAVIGALLTVSSYVLLSGIINAFFHPLNQ